MAMTKLVAVLIPLAAVVSCGKGTVVTDPTHEAEPVRVLAPIDKAAPVDMWQFLKPAFPANQQLGAIAYHTEGDNVYQFSWTASNTHAWVNFKLDGDIWLVEDRTWNGKTFYKFANGGLLWAHRYMTIEKPGNETQDNQMYKVYNYQCETSDQGFRILPHKLQLVDHRYQDLGGDLGMTEVVEVTSEGEGYIWGRGLGLVCWHNVGKDWECNNRFTTVPAPRPTGCRVEGP